MKHNLLLSSSIAFACLIFSSLQAGAQAPDFAWGRMIGNSGATAGSAVAMDGSGNCYIGGIFSTTLTVGANTITHPGPGGSSTFIAKFDSAGTGLWAKKLPFDGLQDEFNTDKILVDAQGNIYLGGMFWNAGQIDGIQLPAPAVSGSYCVVKLDPSGNALWARVADVQVGYVGTNQSIRFDAQGNVCLTALFRGKVILDGGVTLASADSMLLDAFAATYDPNGNLVRSACLGIVNTAPNAIQSYPTEIFKMDPAGNLYRFVTGNRTVVKYDASFQPVLTKSIAVSGGVGLTCMDADAQGNIFISGWFHNGDMTLEGNLIPGFSNSNRTDALLFKLDPAGNLLWYRNYQYVLCDTYSEVRTDGLGNVYCIGQHTGCFGGQAQALMVKFDADGTLLWEHQISPGPLPTPQSPPGHVVPYNIVPAQHGGNMVATGYFRERIVFDSTTAFAIPSGNYSFRMFLAQYGICNTPLPTVMPGNTGICEGDSVLLTAGNGTGFLWSTGDTAASVYVSEPGSYYVLSIENAECFSKSQTVTIHEIPAPDVAVTVNGSELTASAPGMNYQWMDCGTGGIVAGAVFQEFSPATDGSYAVIVSDNSGCADTSDCYAVFNVSVPSLTEQSILLYPNPADDFIRLKSAFPVTGISIYDQLGRSVLTGAYAGEINVSSLPAGAYILHVTTSGSSSRHVFLRK